MHRKRHGMQHQPARLGPAWLGPAGLGPARLGEVVHDLEHIQLVHDVFGGAVVGDEIIAPPVLCRGGIEIEVEGD